MSAAQVWFTLLTALAFVGLLVIGLTVAYWNSIGHEFREWWGKVVVKVLQLPVGLVSIYATYSAAQKEEWIGAAISGWISIALWDVAKELIEARVKAVAKQDEEALGRAIQQTIHRTSLLTLFREAVHEKARRLIGKIQTSTKAGLSLLRDSLTPRTHLDDLLQSIAVYFQSSANVTANVRVGLYVESEGYMEPLRSMNLDNPCVTVFSSHSRHRDSYRIDQQERPALVVTCARRRRTMIIEDSLEAEKQGQFHFFNDDQKEYLRSMLAYYLDEVSIKDGKMARAVLAIDTDCPGFFRESEREFLEFCLREFAARLKLELLLHTALTMRRSQDEPGTSSQAGKADGAPMGTSSRSAADQTEGR